MLHKQKDLSLYFYHLHMKQGMASFVHITSVLEGRRQEDFWESLAIRLASGRVSKKFVLGKQRGE